MLYKLDIFIFRPRTFQLCNPVDIRNDNIYVDDLLQGLQSHDTPFKVKLEPKNRQIMPDVCRHVRSAVHEAVSDEHLRKIKSPICTTCKEHGSNFWLCLYPGCNELACGDADGGQDHSTTHFQAFPTHAVQVSSMSNVKRVYTTSLARYLSIFDMS